MRYSSCVTRRQRRGRSEYVAVLSYYDHNGKRRQKRRTAYSHSDAKRIRRELEDEYLSGGEVALFSDNLTFEDLATHCQQTKYCQAEYDDAGNKLFGVRDTSVYEAHLKHFRGLSERSELEISGLEICVPIEIIDSAAKRRVEETSTLAQ